METRRKVVDADKDPDHVASQLIFKQNQPNFKYSLRRSAPRELEEKSEKSKQGLGRWTSEEKLKFEQGYA